MLDSLRKPGAANDGSRALNRAILDDNLSRVRASVEGLDADECVSVLL